MTPRWIKAKYPGKCRVCSGPIEAGFTVMHIPPRATLCLGCGKRLGLRDAHEAEYRKGAKDHAKRLDPHEKDD